MFRKFVYLMALARERHFGRAAAACNVSQPTLSNALRQLEDELQVLIVERGQRFSGFTPAGEKVLEYARRIVAEGDGLRQELTAMTLGLSGRLRIGAIPTALPLVPHLLKRFAERHPHIRACVTSLSSRDIQRQLDDYELDAAVTYLDNEPVAGVRTLTLYEERYYLLAPRSLLPAGPPATMTWAEAARLPLCLLTPDMQNRRIADTAFAETGYPVTPVVETNSILTLYTMVRSGMTASVVAGQLLTMVAPHPDLLLLPLEMPVITHRVGLVYADREPAVPLAHALATLAASPAMLDLITTVAESALKPWSGSGIDH